MVDDDGRTPEHGHPISSPCEPYGSQYSTGSFEATSLVGGVENQLRCQ